MTSLAPLPLPNASSLSPTFKRIQIDSPPEKAQAAYLPPDLARLPSLAEARSRVHPQPYADQGAQIAHTQQAQHPRIAGPCSDARPKHHRFPSSGQQLHIDTFHDEVAPFHPHPQPAPAPSPALAHRPSTSSSSLKSRKSHARSYSTSHLTAFHLTPDHPPPAVPRRATGIATPTKRTPAATLTGSRFEPRSPGGSRQCTNCAETSTPQWRGLLCNACALWKRARGQDRPVPLKFGGKKVLPPGSRERVKKAGAALTHPQPVFGVIGSKLEYRQQQQHRVNRSETLAEGGIAVRQRAYTGPQGIQPFALAMPPRKSNISSEPMPEYRHFDFPSRACLVDETDTELLVDIAPAHTQDDPSKGIRLPPIGPLLASCPLDPIEVQHHHSRSSSIDHTSTSLLRFSISPGPTPASGSASAASATADSEQRITLPLPVPSTLSRRPSVSHGHSRAASESWDVPGALPSVFGARTDRDVFMHSNGVGRGQGHVRHASDSFSAILARRFSIQGQ